MLQRASRCLRQEVSLPPAVELPWLASWCHRRPGSAHSQRLLAKILERLQLKEWAWEELQRVRMRREGSVELAMGIRSEPAPALVQWTYRVQEDLRGHREPH